MSGIGAWVAAARAASGEVVVDPEDGAFARVLLGEVAHEELDLGLVVAVEVQAAFLAEHDARGSHRSLERHRVVDARHEKLVLVAAVGHEEGVADEEPLLEGSALDAVFHRGAARRFGGGLAAPAEDGDEDDDQDQGAAADRRGEGDGRGTAPRISSSIGIGCSWIFMFLYVVTNSSEGRPRYSA